MSNSSSSTKNEKQLIISHLYLVKFVVNRLTMNLPPGVTKDDLHAIGSMGLIDAAKKFDVTKGVQFKTYSVPRIRGAILDELRRYTLGGQTLCRKARQIEQATKAIEIRKDGESATEDELADELGITKVKLHKMMAEVSRSFLISLDEPTYADNSTTSFADTIEDQKMMTPDIFLEKKEQKHVVKQVIQELPNQEKKVLVLYYFEELTLREIGLVLSVSES
ncbi:MAG: FliA/WhiG family RNA polymerase sigma factor, partial [Candidatus Margulisiibacteriota bacterium]|nr:FliA/WhiG family RNA polymerase sigma factor [Candidatus Margulisiibacteriota bacterium]